MKKDKLYFAPIIWYLQMERFPPILSLSQWNKKLFSWEELFEIMCVLPVRLTTDLTWLRVAVEMREEGVRERVVSLLVADVNKVEK